MKYNRIDRAVLSMVMKLYGVGVSTRKAEKLLEKTIGTKVSSGTASCADKGLDKEIEALRRRELGEMSVLMVNARFEKVRYEEKIRRIYIEALQQEASEGVGNIDS